jgi:hypothetical protein
MRTEERGSKTPLPPSHGLLSCSLAPEQTQYTIHNTPSRYPQSSFSILQKIMRFYLLLLSGLIPGSTVLAQVVTGYRAAACTGKTTFSVTPGPAPACTATCTASDYAAVKSVDMPAGSRCELYDGPDCMGGYQILDAPSAPTCSAVTLSVVLSLRCWSYQGC